MSHSHSWFVFFFFWYSCEFFSHAHTTPKLHRQRARNRRALSLAARKRQSCHLPSGGPAAPIFKPPAPNLLPSPTHKHTLPIWSSWRPKASKAAGPIPRAEGEGPHCRLAVRARVCVCVRTRHRLGCVFASARPWSPPGPEPWTDCRRLVLSGFHPGWLRLRTLLCPSRLSSPLRVLEEVTPLCPPVPQSKCRGHIWVPAVPNHHRAVLQIFCF